MDLKIRYYNINYKCSSKLKIGIIKSFYICSGGASSRGKAFRIFRAAI